MDYGSESKSDGVEDSAVEQVDSEEEPSVSTQAPVVNAGFFRQRRAEKNRKL